MINVKLYKRITNNINEGVFPPLSVYTVVLVKSASQYKYLPISGQ